VQVSLNQRGGLTGGCFGNSSILGGHSSKADSYHSGGEMPIVNPQGELYEDWAQLFEEMPGWLMVAAGKSPKTTGVEKHKRRIKK